MELVVIGSGKYQKMLQEKCERLGIQGQVRFTGSLPVGEAVRRELDSADLFVLPSRAEGLPRAMLEAMARGIPCIGSAVGGIPELLSKDDLVTPGNPKALATKLMSVVSDESRLAEMAARGLRVAESYSADKLQEKRHEFYATVKALTAAHYEIPYARATGGPTVVGC